MKALLIYFAWYTSDPTSVEFDLEDLHDLDECPADEVVAYVHDSLRHFGLPSAMGIYYVSNDVLSDKEDVMFGDMRVTFAKLVGFSEKELKEISEALDGNLPRH